MKSVFERLLTTDSTKSVPLILRIAFAFVMFPHGAQLLAGWFGGYGYTASMGYFASVGLPAPVAFLVIFLEFFGSLFILLGLFTRLFSVALIGLTLGMVLMVHIHMGFFMDWSGKMNGEGFEYHLLMLGVLISLLIAGGGKASLDAALFNKNR